MKTLNLTRICFAAGILLLMLASISCKSKKATTTLQKETGAIEISVPFSGTGYQTDKENFRSRSNGNSIDLATAKKIAVQNAKSEMAGMIQTTIKKVTDQYTNQRQIQQTQEFNNKFEELAREVTNQTLNGVSVIGETIFKETNQTYTYWVAIEANKKNIMDGLDKNLSNNQKLSQDYDKKKFEEIFNTEMEKLAKERSLN